jgi:predicted lipid-binding transport protein (Tim44 family)
MQKSMIFFLFFSVWALSAAAFSQELVIYPAEGQSQDLMEKDKFECYSWAKEQSGFDPMQAPTATAPPPAPQAKNSTAGGAVRGGVGGALLGAGVGAIAGGSKGAKKGAAIGGLSGGVLGGARSHNQQQQDQQARAQWEKEQTQQYAAKRNGYNRAYSACLEGRGYTVK